VARNFSGTRWLQTRAEAAIAYQINTYRVLLTRARYETIIWVPTGDASDATRPPDEFERIAEFLEACGAQALEPAEESNDDAEPDPILL
jgi:hypothetical protein